MATKTATKTTSQKKQRRTLSDWAGDIKEANNVGFSHGYYAVEDLPKARGATTAAKVGFNQGMKARKQSDSYAKRAAKYR